MFVMPINPQSLEEHAAALDGQVWFDLSDRTKIEITGDDRSAFLHSFCTNDIKALPVGRGCEAFLCNARGKILAYVRVFASPTALWIDAAPGLASRIIEHLSHFVITEDVTITDRTDTWIQRLLVGPASEGSLGPAFQGLQPVTSRRVDLASVEVRRTDELGVPSFHMLWPNDGRVVRMSCEQASRDCYEALRIEAGTPEFGQDIDESNYPQEVGRDASTISFTKGCYLGQEPIVMIRDRGQVQRLLMGLTIAGTTPATRGARVWAGDKDLGHVTSSAYSPRLNTAIALAYIRRGSQEPGTALEVELPGAGRGAATVTRLPLVGARPGESP
jgi:folate-binding protein YgfZ